MNLSLIWVIKPDNDIAVVAVFVVMGFCSFSLLAIGLELGAEITRQPEASSSAFYWLSTFVLRLLPALRPSSHPSLTPTRSPPPPACGLSRWSTSWTASVPATTPARPQTWTGAAPLSPRPALGFVDTDFPARSCLSPSQGHHRRGRLHGICRGASLRPSAPPRLSSGADAPWSLSLSQVLIFFLEGDQRRTREDRERLEKEVQSAATTTTSSTVELPTLSA